MTEATIRRATKRRRPTEEKAREAVETFLEDVLGDVPDFTLVEDGDATSAPGKCGWAFWVLHADTTSYVHEDLSIEWYGTRWQKGDPLDHEGEIEERDPSTLGDDAKPAPSGDPDPVTIAPDLAHADNDCDGERCDGEESYVEPWTDYPDGRHRPWVEDYVEPAPQRVRDLLGAPEPDNDCDAADPDSDGLADSEGVDYRTDDCDDVTPCWCGETDPLYDDEGLDATCDGSGTLICHCGGDLCVCHHHGETECPGCEHCAELEGDDDGPFEDGDEDGPGWCDRCSPDPCTCDDGPDDLSDLGPLDEDEETPDA